ncbi:MAG TPA: hypothetical protein VGN10_12590 [Pyrinomonadaceae bacterium]|jgi:hypothetical protein
MLTKRHFWLVISVALLTLAFTSLGPIKDVPAEKLRSTLGVTDVSYMAKVGPLAVVDEALG